MITSTQEYRQLIQQVDAAISRDRPYVVAVSRELQSLSPPGTDPLSAVYRSHSQLQAMYLRITPRGPTDWQWSIDQQEWHPTTHVPQDISLGDPLNVWLLARLHLQSSVRRKALAAHKAKPTAHMPPPLDLSGSRMPLEDAPDCFCCPISRQIMTQPVVTKSGATYDLPCLEHWLATHATDPVSGQPLRLADLRPNYALRDVIEAWAMSHLPLLASDDQQSADQLPAAAGEVSTVSVPGGAPGVLVAECGRLLQGLRRGLDALQASATTRDRDCRGPDTAAVGSQAEGSPAAGSAAAGGAAAG